MYTGGGSSFGSLRIFKKKREEPECIYEKTGLSYHCESLDWIHGKVLLVNEYTGSGYLYLFENNGLIEVFKYDCCPFVWQDPGEFSTYLYSSKGRLWLETTRINRNNTPRVKVFSELLWDEAAKKFRKDETVYVSEHELQQGADPTKDRIVEKNVIIKINAGKKIPVNTDEEWYETSETGEIESKGGICAGENSCLYITDTLKCRVVKYGKDGKKISEWGKKGDKPGDFIAPRAIASDPDGNIYVSDTGKKSILKFDAAGIFIHEIAEKEPGEFSLSGVAGIAADRKQNVYILAGDGYNKVYKFSASGEFVGKWDAGMSYKIAVDNSPKGSSVYLLAGVGQAVYKFRNDGVYMGRWGFKNTGKEYPYYRAYNLATDMKGRVYIYTGMVKSADDEEGTGLLILNADGKTLLSCEGTSGDYTIDSDYNIYTFNTYNDSLEKHHGVFK